MTRRRRDEGGVSSLEFVALAAILVVVLFFMVAGPYRFSKAASDVDSAAWEAARAASLERDITAAEAVGTEAARRTLADKGKECADLDVSVDVSSYEPGGAVSATVVCVADLSDVLMAGFPSSHRFEATRTVPIEQLRGG